MIQHWLLSQFCHYNLKSDVSLNREADGTNHDDPDKEEGVEGEDGEHGQLHHPEVARLLLHEEAGRGLQQMFDGITLWHIMKYVLAVLHVVNQWGFLSVRIAIRIVKIGLANYIYRQLRRVKRRNNI